MTFATGRVIHKLLAPPVSEVTFSRRGFHVGQAAARDYLEQVGCWFLTGLEYGMTTVGEQEIAIQLETVPWEYRGFAYEGASMALTILDGLLPGAAGRLDKFIAGPGAHQTYTSHVGAGWAMARLPRPLRSRIQLRDPLLRWLALDGYGFHEAYFHTPQVVGERRPPRLIRIPAGSGHDAAHVIDQGIGRALWFVCGADVGYLSSTIAGFAPARQADLWAGVGLAAAYAGAPDLAASDGHQEFADAQAVEKSMRELAVQASGYLPDVAQGAAFAAKARFRSGLVTSQTAIAVRVLCGMDVADAARCTDEARPSNPAVAGAYQAWRNQTRRRFTAGAFPAAPGSAAPPRHGDSIGTVHEREVI
jgi:hypothetical protein